MEWEEIKFDETQTAQESNPEHKETKIGDSNAETNGGQKQITDPTINILKPSKPIQST